MIKPLRFLPVIFLLAAAGARTASLVGHELDALIDPQRGTLAGHDTLTLPPGRTSWNLSLHQGMDPQVASGDARLARIGGEGHLERFRLEATGTGPVTLRYSGQIRHALAAVREGMGRERQASLGTIEETGVALDGISGWYPRIEDSLQRFRLKVQFPPGWVAVSQGAGPRIEETSVGVRIGWSEEQPQDDIYLVAAPFERYTQATPDGEAQVYLRAPDAALAQGYLAATSEYLGLYSRLIGPYPYAKFALVENFWETGYGMPSFTLLGPRVIRLPFIVHTSYPHEILHNWWGNGVYPDHTTGNWSEGLTAYLADHLLKERRGEGADYRRDTLAAYADYVRGDEDFPIRAFRGRHGSASQAVGYGKTMMMFHMLRLDLGDGVFVAGLRRFYRDNRFRIAGFDDLRRAFEQESGRQLAGYFRQWTERTGAPELTLAGITVEQIGDGYRLHGRIQQVQADDPFVLTVPIAVHLDGGKVVERTVPLAERGADFELAFPARPLRLDADPRFDLFRRLVPGESPATLSALFGAAHGLIVLPGGAPDGLAEGYRQLAAAWCQGSPGWETVADADLAALPDDRPIWLLGWNNRFLNEIPADGGLFEIAAADRRIALAGETFAGAGYGIALVRDRGNRPIGWIATGDASALPGLTRKLPHYGKYSYLVFDGQAPDNRLKGQWPASDTRLMVWMTDERPNLTVPPRAPLTAVLD